MPVVEIFIIVPRALEYADFVDDNALMRMKMILTTRLMMTMVAMEIAIYEVTLHS